MALSTYSDLKTAVVEWLHRFGDADLTARAGDFVQLGEKRIQRDVRLRAMEVTQTLTADGNGQFTVPTVLLAIKSAVNSKGQPITSSSSTSLADRFAGVAGSPQYMVQEGGKIRTFPPSTPSTGTLTITYYSTGIPLSDTNATNFIFTALPGLYLNAALVEAARYCEAWDSMAQYEQAYQQKKAEAVSADANSRFGGVSSGVRPYNRRIP